MSKFFGSIAVLFLIAVFCLLFSCGESKAERINKLNKLIKNEIKYQEELYKQLSDDSTRNAYLFAEKKESDSKEDSLWKEIKKLESE